MPTAPAPDGAAWETLLVDQASRPRAAERGNHAGVRLEAGGRTRLQICRAEACQSVGGRHVEEAAKRLTGLEFGETSADGLLTLDAVYCLGNCAS
mgnify:CR=1 FL=1